MTNRTLIRDLGQLDRLLPEWFGQDFSFDVETTGLSYIDDTLCGLALTFEDGQSYYVTLKHTLPETAQVTRQVVTRTFDGYDDEEYFTKKKNIRKVKQVARYIDVVTEEVVEEATYSTHQYIDYEDFARRVRGLFSQDNVVMVAHNAKFDMHFLAAVGLRIQGKLADTLLASKLINENREAGLKELSHLVDMNLTNYGELEHYPGFKKVEFLGVPLDLAANYAMMDTEATLALWKLFSVQMVEEGVDHAFRNVWMPLLVTLQEMEARGIALDLEKVEQVRDQYVLEEREHEDIIWREGIKMVLAKYSSEAGREDMQPSYARMATPEEVAAMWIGETSPEQYFTVVRNVRTPMFKPTERSGWRVLTFNTGSNDHLGALIYDWLKLEKPSGVKIANTNSGRPVDKNTLKIMTLSLGPECPPIVTSILERRQAEKIVGTYLNNFLELGSKNPEHRIHTSFNQAIAATGRLTSSNPVNLQNIPSRGPKGELTRSMFIAGPDQSLVVGDFSMMELKMAAHYAAKRFPDHAMLRAFRDGQDLHLLTASTQFKSPYEELALLIASGDVDAKLKRSIGKTSNFGLLYGMGAKKFQTYLWVEVGVYLDIREVQNLIEMFNLTYQEVTEWKQCSDGCRGQNCVHHYVHRHGFVRTISNRKRRVPEIWSDDRYAVMRAERQAVNAIIQGSCADIINEAIPILQDALRPLGGHVLLQVHDEVVCEVPTEYAELAARLVETILVGLVNPKLRVPLTVEAAIGDTWASAKH